MRLFAAFLVITPLLAGCAEAPPPPPDRPSAQITYPTRCDALRFAQDGQDIAETVGMIRLARAPFTVTYHGPDSQPAIALFLTDDVNLGLTRLGRDALWGSAGDFMAHAPDDVPMGRTPRLYRGEAGLAAFARPIGDEYPALLRRLAAETPAHDTAIAAPRAGGGFDPVPGGHAATVKSISGRALASFPPMILHLALFTTRQRVGPPGRTQDLLLMNWGTCRLSFG
ncbi:hypothetical protein [Magnetospirillum moscoviense]|uniref:Uncharacterized protein n=1 Tax=Magnetospirillum moscoviense TaxID=1437059 RepID=A0A178MQY7_9PROT|nr:hypothetical protein [Magnetospirillum moscoviense]OAN50457.1 hypothetical protein A6A05_12390 [Magnetospirillum moscoviense]